MKFWRTRYPSANQPTNSVHLIADSAQLPQWTNAFASVGNGKAMLRTPNGEVEIGLDVQTFVEQGTIDWWVTFTDGSIAVAYSRVVALDEKNCAYTFVLTPPPVPLEQLEGALEAQALTIGRRITKTQIPPGQSWLK